LQDGANIFHALGFLFLHLGSLHVLILGGDFKGIHLHVLQKTDCHPGFMQFLHLRIKASIHLSAQGLVRGLGSTLNSFFVFFRQRIPAILVHHQGIEMPQPQFLLYQDMRGMFADFQVAPAIHVNHEPAQGSCFQGFVKNNG